MLKFRVFDQGNPALRLPLRNAYLLGSDNSAMRADITLDQGMVLCEKREAGVAALVLQMPVGDCGELTIQTCLLPDRDEPYLLLLELVRHRLMTLYTKLEEWSMFELATDHLVMRRAETARKLFIEALCLQKDNPAEAERLAGEALASSIDGSEELALAHAQLLVNRRKANGALPRHPFGVGVNLDQVHERVRMGLLANFDFACLPTPWKALAPEEAEYHWGALDNWIEWAGRNRLPIIAGPLVSFDPSVLPDWLYIWEHDYDTVRDVIYEHIERVVSRYRNVVNAWNVVSGLHVNHHFTFGFDQLMDLTRMATMLVKKIQPAAKTIIEVRQPFGEYFATNPRSIPPMMYADLIIQSAIAFDVLSVKLLMGQAQPGQFTRDLMQVSNLLDQFAVFGKPVYVTVAAPSEPVTSMMIASPDGQTPVDANSGYWRKPWSPLVQSHWLEAVMQIALGKPFVEAVAWHDLADHPQIDLPLAGLMTEDLQPKSAFKRYVAFRKGLAGNGSATPRTAMTTPQSAAGRANPPPPSAAENI